MQRRFGCILCLLATTIGITLTAVGQTASEGERARWNRVFTAETPSFKTAPNDFLVRITKEMQPGTALDLGMGQGRNAVYLARQGWNVTGVDVADEGIRIARESADRLGVNLNALLQSAYAFEFGTDRWDLIAIIYFDARGFESKIRNGLKPGGVVVVEGFHKEATANARIGSGVVWETNELLDLFRQQGLRILAYEDAMGVADYGKQEMRLVRIAAMKPHS